MLYLGYMLQNRIPNFKILCEKEVKIKSRTIIKEFVACVDRVYISNVIHTGKHKSFGKSLKI